MRDQTKFVMLMLANRADNQTPAHQLFALGCLSLKPFLLLHIIIAISLTAKIFS